MTEESQRLLIVDDEKSVRDYLANIGRKLGLEVATAGDRERMERKLVAFSPTVILLDLQMPCCDGIQTLKLLRDLKSDAKVILISGMDDRTLATASQIGEILTLDMAGFLQKPILIDALRAKLGQVNDARALIEPDDLQEAIENGEIRPVYQPKIARDVNGRWRITEAETLARWHRKDSVVVLPSEFIEVAEQSGLLPSLTQSLLRQVAHQLRDWQSRDIHIIAAVNVSPSLLTDSSFPDRLEALMQEHNLDNSMLILELTESAAMRNPELATEILSRLRVKGFGLSIDDFGTGYSSLEQLYRMPFNELKIDRFLVREMSTRSEAAAIVEAIIELGHKLKLNVCAEGVETLELLTRLQDSGCDKCQGYAIGRPASAEALEECIRRFEKTSIPTAGWNARRKSTRHSPRAAAKSSLPLLCL